MMLKMFLKMLSSSRYFRITEYLANILTRKVKNTKLEVVDCELSGSIS